VRKGKGEEGEKSSGFMGKGLKRGGGVTGGSEGAAESRATVSSESVMVGEDDTDGWVPAVSVKEKKIKKRQKEREGRRGPRVGWFGGFWAGPVPGSAQWLPFSFFCSSSFSFLFSYFFLQICKFDSNQAKPILEIF
jgi:hypothetical protein